MQDCKTICPRNKSWAGLSRYTAAAEMFPLERLEPKRYTQPAGPSAECGVLHKCDCRVSAL